MRQKTYNIFRKQGIKAFTGLRFSGLESDCGPQSSLPYAGLDFCPYAGNNPDVIEHNRAEFCHQNRLKSENLFFPRQTHSRNVIEIDSEFLSLNKLEQTRMLEGVDALVTNLPDATLGIFTADCMTVFLYDPVHRAIGLAHSGWRGTVQKITQATVQCMKKRYGSRPQDLLAAVAPHICAKHYEVGPELAEAFEAAGFDTRRVFKPGRDEQHLQLDLSAAIRQSLLELGIPKKHMEISRTCSYQHPERFYSARRLGGASGRTPHCIGLR